MAKRFVLSFHHFSKASRWPAVKILSLYAKALYNKAQKHNNGYRFFSYANEKSFAESSQKISKDS